VIKYKRKGTSAQSVVTLACPFCGEDLKNKELPNHLRYHCEQI